MIHCRACVYWVARAVGARATQIGAPVSRLASASFGAARELARGMTPPRIILVATDFSEVADHALAYAAKLGAHLDATLHLLHAITLPAMGVPELGVAYASMNMGSTTEKAQASMDERVARFRDHVAFGPTRIEVGDARDVIDNVAEQISADLVVLGTHGRRGIRRALLGSVAESVVRSAPCPVLTIRPLPTKP